MAQDRIVYIELRADGWPLCPHCGLDELFCPDMYKFVKEKHRNPDTQECIELGLQCYACMWSSEYGLRVSPWVKK